MENRPKTLLTELNCNTTNELINIPASAQQIDGESSDAETITPSTESDPPTASGGESSDEQIKISQEQQTSEQSAKDSTLRKRKYIKSNSTLYDDNNSIRRPKKQYIPDHQRTNVSKTQSIMRPQNNSTTQTVSGRENQNIMAQSAPCTNINHGRSNVTRVDRHISPSSPLNYSDNIPINPSLPSSELGHPICRITESPSPAGISYILRNQQPIGQHSLNIQNTYETILPIQQQNVQDNQLTHMYATVTNYTLSSSPHGTVSTEDASSSAEPKMYPSSNIHNQNGPNPKQGSNNGHAMY